MRGAAAAALQEEHRQPWHWSDYLAIALFASIVATVLLIKSNARYRAQSDSNDFAAQALGTILLHVGVVPAVVLLAALPVGGGLAAARGWTIEQGWEFVVVDIAGMPHPFVYQHQREAGERWEVPFALLGTLVALSLMGLAAAAPSAAKAARALAPGAGGVARFVSVYMPAVYLAATCLAALPLMCKESWHFKDAFLYVLSASCGVSNHLTQEVPLTLSGRLFAVVASSAMLAFSGATAGVVALHPSSRAMISACQGDEAADNPHAGGGQGERAKLGECWGEVAVALSVPGAFVATCLLWGMFGGSLHGGPDGLAGLALIHCSIAFVVLACVALYRRTQLMLASQLRSMRSTVTLALVTLLLVPMALLAASLALGAALARCEGWRLPVGFYYTIDNAAGLGTELTETAPQTILGFRVGVAGGLLMRLLGAACMGLVASTPALDYLAAVAPQSVRGLVAFLVLAFPVTVALLAVAFGMCFSATDSMGFRDGFVFAVVSLCSIGARPNHKLAQISFVGKVLGVFCSLLAIPVGGICLGLFLRHPTVEAIASDIEGVGRSSGRRPKRTRGCSLELPSGAFTTSQAEGSPDSAAANLSRGYLQLCSSGSAAGHTPGGSSQLSSHGATSPLFAAPAHRKAQPTLLRGWGGDAGSQGGHPDAAASPRSREDRAKLLREQIRRAQAELQVHHSGEFFTRNPTARAALEWRIHHFQQELLYIGA